LIYLPRCANVANNCRYQTETRGCVVFVVVELFWRACVRQRSTVYCLYHCTSGVTLAPQMPPFRRSLSSIPERTPTMIPIEDEPVPVVVEAPNTRTLHHLPIAFALLPAAAGLVVGGGEKWTDVMLLGLAGVYLNWLVKCIPPKIERLAV
jgi:hypothetical protein